MGCTVNEASAPVRASPAEIVSALAARSPFSRATAVTRRSREVVPALAGWPWRPRDTAQKLKPLRRGFDM